MQHVKTLQPLGKTVTIWPGRSTPGRPRRRNENRARARTCAQMFTAALLTAVEKQAQPVRPELPNGEINGVYPQGGTVFGNDKGGSTDARYRATPKT